ncbi:MAG: hypothetical protein HC819_19305 [Cyclobacteriaceae bacterium]|nr:hypothetical protein [Cyclobacteriaceae bacterium]
MDMVNDLLNWFGLIYVGLPLCTLFVFAIFLLSGKKIFKENIDRIIDFGKWYIVSVALVFSAKIIESSFTERETGIKEMQVYDKYVSTILEADNIEARWKLAEYFSTVTPTDRLRTRWVEYKLVIESDYKKFKDLEEKENELLSKDSLTVPQVEQLSFVQKEKASFERRLVETNIGRWVIVFTGDSDLEGSIFELNKLKDIGVEDVNIYLRSNSYRTISKIFSNKREATSYLNSFRGKIRSDAYVVDLDKWCLAEDFNGEYYECK